jgi:dienelactone hydrolase
MKLSQTITIASLLFSFTTASAAPELTGQLVEYKSKDKSPEVILEGFVARPSTKDLKKRPAVIVVHEWMGIEDYTKDRVRALASLGYVAFAADIYGKGVRAKNQDEALKLATIYRSDRPLMRARVEAAIHELKKRPDVDPNKIAIIGHCFGGTAALEAARGQLPVLGAVSFHGGLSTTKPEETKSIKAKVLVLHGADDPYVPDTEVKTFQDEMRKAKADWQFISYSDAVHAFSNPGFAYKPGQAFGYNEPAARRSWQAMETFLNEIFNQKSKQ